MKKLIILLLLSLFSSSFDWGDSQAVKDGVDAKKVKKVYICTGPQSKCYHKTPTCRGLKSCSKDIIKVSKDEAINKYGRRACKVCYGK